MNYYMAPLEGLTTYVFRNAYHHYFEPMDKYFTPFLVAGEHRTMTSREKNDILPEHNENIQVIPQILTNHAQAFIKMASTLRDMGYEEVNLNLGCPSMTVVSKGRGAGFLSEPEKLDQFLEDIFSWGKMKISVKSRIGRYHEEEFDEILSIYNKYPLEELILHPRVQQDFYQNTPRYEVYGKALKNSNSRLCYNGDIVTVQDCESIVKSFPDTSAVMIGRGIMRNPWLLEEIKMGSETSRDIERWKEFHDQILSDYQEVISGDRNVLFKMKELWSYFLPYFDQAQKEGKKIRKAQRIADYKAIVQELYSKNRK